MFRPFFKILGVLLCLWFMCMMTILRGLKYKHTFVQDISAYDRALEQLKKNYNGSQSAFQVWRMAKPAPLNMTEEEKLSILQAYHYPPGVNGTPVILEDDLKTYAKPGLNTHSTSLCKNQTYPDHLPSVSIIICFYDEAWTTLLRTLHSVINRTPTKYIREIILFDDNSTDSKLRIDLEDYVRRFPKVILVKSAKREGLIVARMKAMRYATGEVMVFLDSHCECTKGWLEPLLDRIAKDPTIVASPVVDTIDQTTFEYIPQDTNNLRIGGFTWRLKFIWMVIPRRIKLKRPNPAEPIHTPTISGGIFAINRQFFEKIGLYDDVLELWGGENLELSFKTWMCGGSMEIVPCSHVGHIFRKRMPYRIYKTSTTRNLMRVAEVWMDDYKKYFLDRIGNPMLNYKDVSSRQRLRDKLKCKSFKWYLKNVYPQLEIPDNYAASGRIYNIDFSLCIDATLEGENAKLQIDLLPCHNSGGNQYFTYTRHGQIKRDEHCLEIFGKRLLMLSCRERVGSQRWLYNNMTYHIRNLAIQKCLQVSRSPDNKDYELTLNNCVRPTIPVQKWAMDKFKFEKLDTDLYAH